MTKNAPLRSMHAWMDDAALEAGPVAADVIARMGRTASTGQDSLQLSTSVDIFEDDELRSIRSRGLAYLRAGVPIHLRGPAGTGKTTLALDIAVRLGRPLALVTGDNAMTSADLVGREIGSSERHVHDQYVHRVTRRESVTRADWADSILTRALIEGWTLVYDEFTRAPASANNPLLSALEERVLVISNPVRGTRHVRAHPEFRAIFTSNPMEYAGVAEAPDALMDRLITFDLGWYSPETEAGIVSKRTGLPIEDASTVVMLARALRNLPEAGQPPSLRTAVMIGRLMQASGVSANRSDPRYVQICLDVFAGRAPRERHQRERYLAVLEDTILSQTASRAAE